MKDKYLEKIIIFSWIIFLFICLFLLSFTSHAEEVYFPMSQNANGLFTDFDIQTIESYYDSENYNIFAYFSGYAPGYGTRMKNFYIVRFPKDQETEANIYGEIYSNGYTFSLYAYSNPVLTYGYLQILEQNWTYPYSASMSNFQNIPSNIYNTDIDYVSNFRVYTTNTKEVTVLRYGSDNPIVDLGTAILPGPFIDPIYSTGDTPPSQVPPSFTINNYTWTTNNPPSFDSSSVEAGLESLGDIISYQIGWISDNLHGEFTTLTGNLKGLFDYIGKTIQYYGNAIISSINNGIQNFYDNMLNLVQPIFDKISYITQPIDGTVIYDNISTTSLVSNISTINSCLSSFQSSFNNVSEPESFKIPIHLENLPIDYFGIQQVQYIDLGVLGSTEKGLIRTFMWALITYSLFITIVDSISNYINGGGDES